MSPFLFYAYIAGVVVTALVLTVAIGTAIAAGRERMLYARELRRRTTEADVAQARQELQRLSKELEGVESQRRQSIEVIEQAKRDRAWLDASQEKLGAAFAQMREINERQVLLEELRRKVDTLEERRAKQHEGLLDGESQRRQVQDEIHGLQAEKGRLANDVADLREEVSQLQGSRSSVSQEIAGLEQQRSSLRGETTALAAKNAKETEEAKQLRADLSRLRQEHADLSAKHAGLLSQKEQLEKTFTDAEKRREKALAQMEKDIENTERRLHEVKDRVEREISEAKADAVRNGVMVDSDEPLAELFRPVIHRKAMLSPLPSAISEREQLDRAREYLRSQGLVFPDRLLLAFHTSLKCSADSPLLVLAGISGTGKSLLPRRYAEAMGMHFLPVPIQPRWDGPQDLFGFFHHLHGRYIATPLCRALVQMDRLAATSERGWTPGKGFEPLSERMLIVLLDEMNLARVEYYFSEMISRLEMRRDIDPESSASRSAAEVVLDVGPQREGMGDPRIYIDNNVLFVGTMNEDESSQSLSDRVIDRANVMRFARPTAFKHDGDSKEQSPSEQYLRYDTWRSWLSAAAQRADYAELEGEIEDWIVSVNEELAKIGKPFGHRVRRAIHSYLRYYPEEGASALKSAMADQLEQRVLPKVRGMELGTTAAESLLDALQRLCGKLGDEALGSAIREGRADGHQFHWQGVMREVAADVL